MDHKPDHRAPRPTHRHSLDQHNKLGFTDFDLEDLKRSPRVLVSPSLHSSPQKVSPAAKGNCLCSPTTHIGSFRCRHHRHSAGILRGGSVGSNLSDLDRKSSEFMGFS